MIRHRLSAVFVVCISLSTTVISVFNSPQLKAEVILEVNSMRQTKNLPSVQGDTIKIAICQIRTNGEFNVTIKEMLSENYKYVLNQLTSTIVDAYEYSGQLESILGVFKESDLIGSDMTLQDIFDRDVPMGDDTAVWNLSIMEPFIAHFSPVLIVGMGFGAGIADTIGLFSGNIYSLGVIGLGGVLCIDAFAKTIYAQYTFTFPLLIHVLSGFVGIMMFPIHLDSLYTSGLPFKIYSNFVAFGLSGLTIGVPIPADGY
jgi:hypothetical protein